MIPFRLCLVRFDEFDRAASAAANAGATPFKEQTMSHETQSLNRVRDQAQKQVRDLNGFDYNAPAELYPSRIKKGRGRVTYKRFNTAAEALRFAIEEIPPAVLLGAYLEVEEARFGVQEIRFLYDSAGYPLKRAAVQN
jgi:hypothetical protein